MIRIRMLVILYRATTRFTAVNPQRKRKKQKKRKGRKDLESVNFFSEHTIPKLRNELACPSK